MHKLVRTLGTRSVVVQPNQEQEVGGVHPGATAHTPLHRDSSEHLNCTVYRELWSNVPVNISVGYSHLTDEWCTRKQSATHMPSSWLTLEASCTTNE